MKLLTVSRGPPPGPVHHLHLITSDLSGAKSAKRILGKFSPPLPVFAFFYSQSVPAKATTGF